MRPEQNNYLTLSDLKDFLRRNGWKESITTKKTVRYEGPISDFNRPLELVLPISENFEDFDQRASDIVRVLSKIYKRTEAEITDEIRRIKRDIFKIRVIHTGNNGIPLSYAADSINAIKNLYIYSACSEEISLPYFDKPSISGQHHAELCEFDHTFHGSFGFTINSPIKAGLQFDMFDNSVETPFERRVMERIIRGLEDVEKSVHKDNADYIVENFETGLNSRMCESLLSLLNYKSRQVEFSIDWSHTLEAAEDIRHKNKWRLGSAAYEVIEYAAEELRKVEPHDVVIIGKVVTLHSTKNPRLDSHFLGSVTVKHIFEGKYVNVKINLNSEGYTLAVEAHLKGIPIRLEGKLFRKGNTWKIVDITSIQLFV
jgi:hypothetical protein